MVLGSMGNDFRVESVVCIEEVEIRRHPRLFIIKSRESFNGIIQLKRMA
ncbi:hypothetical protein HanXRQr2_Chr02g0074491 [Helianthus annuus]|uniref:Uncharacterized protein n=1 Tax=Helianthus annuus TaxID=4232 RepID=A0A9K3JQ07_HELAN|nr:hypothetical protein HanXRQr2_Chr02g0074491 [Helianthus annuus]